jgi:isoquinoline 1-oxidoreductase beta subunit
MVVRCGSPIWHGLPAPTIHASAKKILNGAKVRAMPGVTDVALIPHTPYVAGGAAVRAKTFGQCIDAIRALQVTWGPGSVDDKTETSVLADLKAAELPMTPAIPLTNAIDETFTFYQRPGIRSSPTAQWPMCAPIGRRSGPV